MVIDGLNHIVCEQLRISPHHSTVVASHFWSKHRTEPLVKRLCVAFPPVARDAKKKRFTPTQDRKLKVKSVSRPLRLSFNVSSSIFFISAKRQRDTRQRQTLANHLRYWQLPWILVRTAMACLSRNHDQNFSNLTRIDSTCEVMCVYNRMCVCVQPWVNMQPRPFARRCMCVPKCLSTRHSPAFSLTCAHSPSFTFTHRAAVHTANRF